MIEGAKWRRWIYFYIPLTAFILWLLFPFYWLLVTSVRPDRELYRPWMAPNYAPFWTMHPTLVHISDLLTGTLFIRWMANTLFIAIVSTLISLFCGILAGYALSRLKFRFAGTLGTGIFITYLVPQTLLFIPLANIIRKFQLGDTPLQLSEPGVVPELGRHDDGLRRRLVGHLAHAHPVPRLVGGFACRPVDRRGAKPTKCRGRDRSGRRGAPAQVQAISERAQRGLDHRAQDTAPDTARAESLRSHGSSSAQYSP